MDHLPLLWSYKLGALPSQKQLGMVSVLQVLLDEVSQKLLEHHGGILHPSLQCRHEEGRHVASVAHRERPLGLQRVDEHQQEHLVMEQLAKETQGLLYISWRLQREKRGGGSRKNR